ncbi:MAG TPA: hypothetical protein VHA57_08190 [Actinomycetota bacterium]|nr:hypothetical protein [Actinomycetota bacterium]
MARPGLVGFALSRSLLVGMVALGAAGFGYVASQISATTRLQLSVGDRERGWVMALWSLYWLGLRPFASLNDGRWAGLWGSGSPRCCLRYP